LLVDKDSVKTWPEPLKNIVFNAADQATKQQRIFAAQEDALCMQAMTADGCKLVELTAEEREEFRKAADTEVSVIRSQFSDELIALFESDLASAETS